MFTQEQIKAKLRQVFDERQSEVLSEVITTAYREFVRAGDFNEPKPIVKDLSLPQKKTEQSV